jgi:hypothetical protein
MRVYATIQGSPECSSQPRSVLAQALHTINMSTQYSGPRRVRVEHRQAVRPIKEESVVLAIHHLVKAGIIGPNLTHEGTLAWSSRVDSPPYETQLLVETADRDGWLTLTRAGTDQRVWLFCPDLQPHWGLLWAYECPGCSAPVRLLYLPPFERSFACRRCHRVAYQSQTCGRLGAPSELWRPPRFLAAPPAELPRPDAA